MTLDEFSFYSDMTVRLFNYMNGRINTLNNKCNLSIEMYDLVNGVKGNIYYPNYVTIFVGTIIDSYDDIWSSYVSKHDFIGMCIAWAISHELHHADQLISMIRYGSNSAYKAAVENDVERASYDWLINNSDIISSIGGFHCDMRKIKSSALTAEGDYTKASVKQFYLQTIANIIIRDLNVFYSIKAFTDDNYAQNIVLEFGSADKITIKSMGKYMKENINAFSDMVYKYCGQYDRYSIIAHEYKYTDSSSTTLIRIEISDPIIYPMIFKK